MKLKTVSTGLPALDQILGGGLLEAGVYIIQGTAGTGKTILANQLAFGCVAAGGKVAYVTVLAESHARMMQHMELFSFFRESVIPGAMHYISAFDALTNEGLAGVADVLGAEMRRRKVNLVVVDGLVSAAQASGSPRDLKLFIGQLQAMSTLGGCNTLLLHSAEPAATTSPEQTMVDGILVLRQQLVRSRHERLLEVTKFRGSSVLYGAHSFRIGEDGIALFPQLETLPASTLPRAIANERVTAGVPGLDEMLGGGYPVGSVTAISGPEGSGKTLLGLQFLAAATAGDAGLLFGLDDSGEMADAIGEAFGMRVRELRERSALRVVPPPRFTESLDEVGYRLLAAVRDSGARRVFIDGLVSVVAMPAYEERGSAFFTALFHELRRLGVSTLFSVRLGHDGTALPPGADVSPIADNSLRLRVRERGHTIVRTVSIAKVQASRHDLSVRELELTPSGLRVGAPLDDSGRVAD